jgi:FkbM family methyltransferase
VLLDRIHLLIASRVRLPCSAWRRIEAVAAKRQGKGFGAATCDWEISVCADLLGDIPRVVIDVGANVGAYASGIVRRFPGAAVHCFEPSSRARDALSRRFAGNSFVRVHRHAISDRPAIAELWSNAEGSALASLSRRELGHMGIDMSIHETVEVARLDALWGEFRSETVDWIKLDVEGHELAAIRGLGERLGGVRLIQFEFGGCNLDTRTSWKDFWTLFSAAGWAVYRISPSGPRPIKRYREIDEHYRTTNFVAVRRGSAQRLGVH